MNKLLIAIILLVAIALSQCKITSHATVAAPTVAPAPPAATAPTVAPAPDAIVTTGRTVFETSCNRCHNQPRAGDYNNAQWVDIMVRMSRKAHLSDADTKAVLAYLNTASKQ